MKALRLEKNQKKETSKKPRKLFSYRGFRYCESGGEEEIRTRFDSVSVRAKPAQYGFCAPLACSIRRYSAL